MTAIKDTLERTAIMIGQHPDTSRRSLAATGELGCGAEVEMRIGRHRVPVDASVALGGGGAAPSPAQHALAALGSCLALTYRIRAEQLGITIDRLRVEVRADLDMRGALGLADDVRPGFTEVRVGVHLSGPEPTERYEELRRSVERRSAVLDAFVNRVSVATVLDVTR